MRRRSQIRGLPRVPSWFRHGPMGLAPVLLSHDDPSVEKQQIRMPLQTVRMKPDLPARGFHRVGGIQQRVLALMKMMHQRARRRIRQGVQHAETPVFRLGTMLQFFRDLFFGHPDEIHAPANAPRTPQKKQQCENGESASHFPGPPGCFASGGVFFTPNAETTCRISRQRHRSSR